MMVAVDLVFASGINIPRVRPLVKRLCVLRRPACALLSVPLRTRPYPSVSFCVDFSVFLWSDSLVFACICGKMAVYSKLFHLVMSQNNQSVELEATF